MVHLVKTLLTAAAAFSSLASAYVPQADNANVKNSIQSVSPPTQVTQDGSYMRVASYHDGTLVGGYAIHDDTTSKIVAVVSKDSGKTWKYQGTVVTAPKAGRDLDNAYPFILPSGEVLMAFRNHVKQNGKNVQWRISLSKSTDGARTWDWVSNIDSQPVKAGEAGLWEPFLRTGKDGSVEAYYSLTYTSSDQNNVVKRSHDQGKTWSAMQQATGPDITGRDGMITVAKRGNDENNLIAVFESSELGPMAVWYETSSDGGYTWGNRHLLYRAKDGSTAGSPQIIRVGSTLVVTFMTDEARPASGVDGGEQKGLISKDGGNTWSAAIVVSPLNSHWPGLWALNENEFLSVYALDGQGMLSHRFRV